MALEIPSYPNPYDPSNPLANVYGWIPFVCLDSATGNGRLVLSIHPGEAAWANPSLARLPISLGQEVAPGVSIASLAELMAETTTIGATGLTFAQCYAALGLRLYQEIAAKVPALAGSTIA